MLVFIQGAFGVTALQIGALSVAILVPITNIVSVLVIFLLRDNCRDAGLSGAIFTELAETLLLGRSSLVAQLIHRAHRCQNLSLK